MAKKTGWPKPDKYRAAIKAGFAAMRLLGLSFVEQARMFSKSATTKEELRKIERNLAETKFQNMDILDRSKYLVEIHKLALRKHGSALTVARWVHKKERGVSPVDLLTTGHLHHVVMVLLWLQKLNGIPQDSKLVDFVDIVEEILARRISIARS